MPLFLLFLRLVAMPNCRRLVDLTGRRNSYVSDKKGDIVVSLLSWVRLVFHRHRWGNTMIRGRLGWLPPPFLSIRRLSASSSLNWQPWKVAGIERQITGIKRQNWDEADALHHFFAHLERGCQQPLAPRRVRTGGRPGLCRSQESSIRLDQIIACKQIESAVLFDGRPSCKAV